MLATGVLVALGLKSERQVVGVVDDVRGVVRVGGLVRWSRKRDAKPRRTAIEGRAVITQEGALLTRVGRGGE